MSEQERARKVLLVDDHPLVRQGMRDLLVTEDGWEVCGEAESAPAAMEAARRGQPDLAIVDLSLRQSSGVDLIRDLRELLPNLKVVVLSMHGEPFYVERALRAGAQGYLVKGELSATVIEAIRAVLAGGTFVSPKVAGRMVARMTGQEPAAVASLMDRLTEREAEIFELFGQGLSMKEAAARLSLSVKTIDAHRENMKGKLGLDTTTELLALAITTAQVGLKNFMAPSRWFL